MKNKLGKKAILYIVVAMTAAFIFPAAGGAFWYGDQLPPFIPPGPDAGGVDVNDVYTAFNEWMHTPQVPGIATSSMLSMMYMASFASAPQYLVPDPENPDEFVRPEGVQHHDYGRSQKGYILLSSLGGGYCPKGVGNCPQPNPDDPTDVAYRDSYWNAILIDYHGNVINGWTGNPFPAKMLPGGHVLMAYGRQEEQYQSPEFRQYDWFGNIKWKWDNSRPWPCSGGPDPANPNPRCVDGWAVTGQHHDWQREGNPVGYYAPGMKPKRYGKTLILSSIVTTLDETGPYSDNYISDYRLIEDVIYIVDMHNNKL